MASWVDIDDGEYMVAGNYFCKITDFELFAGKECFVVRCKFATADKEHNESFFISEKAIWRLSKFIKDIGISDEQRKDLDIKRDYQRDDCIKILAWLKKYALGICVKLEIVVNQYNTKYHQMGRVRRMKPDEPVSELTAVDKKFPTTNDNGY